MNPIPKYVLCHSAVLTINFAPDKFGKSKGSVSAPLENVRFEPASKHEQSVEINGHRVTAKMFFDCVNSACALPFVTVGGTYDGEVVTSQVVTFNGSDYSVEEIRQFYDDSKLHHLEVLLSGQVYR